MQPPKSYNLIVALESRAKFDLNIEYVTARLFHEELKKKDVKGLNERGSTLVARMSKTTFCNRYEGGH